MKKKFVSMNPPFLRYLHPKSGFRAIYARVIYIMCIPFLFQPIVVEKYVV